MPVTNQNNSSAGKVKIWLPVFLCMAVIFIASSIPEADLAKLFNFQDIVFHLSAYSILSFFFSKALKETFSGISRARIIVYTCLFGIIYGISDEWHQLYVPCRCVSGLDIFIDGVGSLLGSLIYLARNNFSNANENNLSKVVER